MQTTITPETKVQKEGEVFGNLAFVKEVTRYFMDFLETDFHKRKNPRRSIKLRNPDNLLVGSNLSKYPSFAKAVWSLVNKSFNKDALSTITKGVYRSNLPQSLLDLINLQVGKISTSEVNTVVENITEDIEKNAVLYKEEYERAYNVCLESTSFHIKKDLVLPFVGSIEKSVESLGIGDENDIYLMEEELTEVLLRMLENKVSEVLKKLIAEEKVNLKKEIRSVFDSEVIQVSILNFFEAFQVGDLFSELFEMDRNKAILDKQDFYLYFFDITFNKNKYPIFYTPFTLKRDNDIYRIEFDAQVYINKRALEFIVQEFNTQTGTRGTLNTIADRIIYLSQHKEDLTNVLESILSELENTFGLDKSIDISDTAPQQARSMHARISNSLYIGLFDKSDEALVNDYEEILQQLNSENGTLATMFNVLVEDFIHKNPEPVNPEVENEWGETNVPDRLVSQSPIPLNSEQLQILSAIRKDKCKYLIVEGPPGTGKSHTITAIIFDAILRHQSVLVLSDKKEALDVVEDKITETMDRVRFDEEGFQNPILRLGKTGSNYSQVLAKPAIEKIKVHYKAVKKDYSTLVENISKLENSLKEDIEAEIVAYDEISLSEIRDYYDLENYFEQNEYAFDIDELTNNQYEIGYLEELRSFFRSFPQQLNNNTIIGKLGISTESIQNLEGLGIVLAGSASIAGSLLDVSNKYADTLHLLSKLGGCADDDFPKLERLLRQYKDAKLPLLGYALSRAKVEELNRTFRELFPYAKYEHPESAISEIKATVEIFEHLNAIRKHSQYLTAISSDYLGLMVDLLLNTEAVFDARSNINAIKEQVDKYLSGADVFPRTLEKLGISQDDITTWMNNRLLTLPESDFEKAMRFAGVKSSIVGRFGTIPLLSYAEQKKEIEMLVTTQVTHLLDERLIEFYEYNKNDAETLRNIIKDKKKFPKEQFAKLKDAFPCILAGIRDYAEYIPLEAGIFDLVIIDEASQVSIAQAFPALIRAKKVLILGDKKQFSNVKAAQARSETNREYLNSLSEVFRREVSSEDSKLVKLAKFDIKTSILEFFEFISNYNIQLLKHFRGYKEIISYSNKYFYQNSLQVMKIRGKGIDEVLKFTFVEQDGKEELLPNSNKKEVEAIILELQKLRELGSSQSVGIITPHTNQQKVIVDEISKLPERDYYFDNLRLKIMTFDTCQGEERDIVFYSMVATETSDRLWGVFIKDFNSVDNEEDGKIKAQRLNVGFSRAKECAHFILSQPLDKFTGSIGDALRHYSNILEEAKKEKTSADVDQKSKMEPEVLNWFYQTDFWQRNKDKIEFIPQFEIGRYLKQLDVTYHHPQYKVDFLLVYRDDSREHKIVIEYDGFKEHFRDIDEVNELNYKNYYSEEDIYREKVLESYGYKFLRINKFNIGANPITTLNQRIESLVKNNSRHNSILDGVHQTVEGLKNGDKKECPKCKEIRDTSDFKDIRLITGYGRFCRHCKGEKENEPRAPRPEPVLSNVTCPRCSSRMILRNGRKGKFYGCSKFPYCRGTRNM